MSYCSCFNRALQWFTDCSEDEVFGRGSEETTNSMATYVKILVKYGVSSLMCVLVGFGWRGMVQAAGFSCCEPGRGEGDTPQDGLWSHHSL